MKIALALVLALFSSLSFAKFDCEPKTSYNANARGSKLVSVKNDNGTADAFWCPIFDAPSGTTVYRTQYHIVLNQYKDLAYSVDAFRRIMNAPSFLEAFNDETTAKQIIPKPGIEKYNYDTLRYLACVKLVTPPIDVPVNPPAGFCGVVPILPIDTFKTPASGSFSLFTYNAGKLTGLVYGRKAAANALCNCFIAQAITGAKTYCALQTGSPIEVTECVKVP